MNDSLQHRDESKLIAFYLPQFHRIPENSQWWSPGFTEWTNVAKAKPNFVGHHQPRIPRELGFYDLEYVDAMREQTDLAREYGIHGFCFYYYWFSGRRILERPLDNFLQSDIDFPFCLCWANESWTRTWDGKETDILLQQTNADGDEERFIQDIYPFLSDSRYIRVDDKPMLLIYRIKQFSDYESSIKKWRKKAASLGLPGLHIVTFDHHTLENPDEITCDGIVEFPPLKYIGGGENHNTYDQISSLHFINKTFHGRIIDYQKMAQQGIFRSTPSFTLYRGILPDWDNTPRRQNDGTIVVNGSPEKFGVWLKFLRVWTQKNRRKGNDDFIFINAWNEWAEGAYLEPDLRWGRAYLEAAKRSAYIMSDDLISVETAQESAIHNLRQICTREVTEFKQIKKIEQQEFETEHRKIAYDHWQKSKTHWVASKRYFFSSIVHILRGKTYFYNLCRKFFRFFK